MDAEQGSLRNPLGLDEACTNCPALSGRRERVVHGYGDVGADVLVVGGAPTAGAEATGVPFTGDATGRRMQALLRDLGLNDSPPPAEAPEVTNAYLTYLTRCRHPDREPTGEEVAACDPFLNAEIRMINPEAIVPVGGRALRAVAAEHTAGGVGDLDVDDAHATEIRGRGFLLVPVRDPARWTDDDREAALDALEDLAGGAYRGPKGRRGRRERAEVTGEEGRDHV